MNDRDRKHRPRKRFGQHFLKDPGTIARITDAINPMAFDHLVEIGPGQGALTNELIANCRRLDIIELDRDLAKTLSEKYAEIDTVKLHSADALSFNFNTLSKPQTKLRIVGNLPYNISTPLIFHLIECSAIISDMHFMLQKEVVDRISAQPGGKTYGKLSIMVQFTSIVEKLFDVSPECFEPAPKVISSVVRIVPRNTPTATVKDLNLFKKVVTQAFSQRRKTLKNNLKSMITADQMSALGIDPSARAETLSIDAFARLGNQIFDNQSSV